MTRLAGRTVLVTGATSGIGLEAAAQLAGMGADTVMVARNSAKGVAAMADVKARSRSQKVTLLICDFSSQASIRRLADSFRAANPRLDILVNNAGTVSPRRQVTEDGLEQTFAVNHLGYFLLTNLLLDLMMACAPARIVNVASVAHRHAAIDFDNLQFEHGGYGILPAYGRSKLANIHFTTEIARRLGGTGVTANCLHPGRIATNIWSHAPWYVRPVLSAAKRLMESPVDGGRRIVHLAASPEVEGLTGGYYVRNARTDPSRAAQDASIAKRLWEVSTRLVGVQPR